MPEIHSPLDALRADLRQHQDRSATLGIRSRELHVELASIATEQAELDVAIRATRGAISVLEQAIATAQKAKTETTPAAPATPRKRAAK